MKVLYEYTVDIDLPVPFTDDFLALIPRQRAMVNKLMNEGVISSYALSLESGKLWVNVISESDEDVKVMIEGFPIAMYIIYKVHKLTFHNSISFKIPNFSVN